MSSIRCHPKLRMLFRVNQATGLVISEGNEDAAKSKLRTVWEVATLVLPLFSLCLVLNMQLEEVSSFRIVELSQPISIFMIYSMVLAKAVNLLAKKRKLKGLLAKIDEIVQFQPFEKCQPPVVDLICKRIHKTTIILFFISVSCVFASTAIFIPTIFLQQGNFTIKNDDSTNPLLKVENLYSPTVIVTLSLNEFFTYVLLIKNIAMDSFMFFCHYFVVQQLNLLNRKFNESNKMTFMIKTSTKFAKESNTINFENWLHMFNKIRQ